MLHASFRPRHAAGRPKRVESISFVAETLPVTLFMLAIAGYSVWMSGEKQKYPK